MMLTLPAPPHGIYAVSDHGAGEVRYWFDILCVGAAYGLLLLLAFAAPFVLLLFVRASPRLRIVMVMSATVFVLMALYGVALLSDLIPA
jgi:hypothetical protein